MSEKIGIIAVSHSAKIADGLHDLIDQIAKDVPAAYAGGLEDGSIGTSFDKISQAIDSLDADTILAFYDLGSARMNLEMAQEMADKKIIVNDVPLVEGTYAAAALLAAGVALEDVQKQLAEIMITK